MALDPKNLHDELTFQTARSGGAGGQNVNKVETKVELRFDVAQSKLLTDEERALLLQKLASKITNEGILTLYHQTERTQLANKEKVIRKFNKLIEQAFVVAKKRLPVPMSAAAKDARRQAKERNAAVKANRKKIDLE
ncbi:MAG: aminoacyl-tRNA hydrolase [Cytophagia bacterium]|nr:MAG: aminoacyl-tRNA hydrolase [Runella sp.]TAG17940.1 MAG: aminoacyl-tRNA hydrolase [Cytophagales bacterium]TAG37448.1 MAG: aminoacyl-tRNA hydrolase [Cytophagia bacterium]TAG54145.1 MAG: aminoacyl-tRNA hydrolase [Runella slithyformis]TAG78518.1 MAG: aminoacyl-tRNA hydrolase [Cytophagales bacterium]